LGKVLKVRVVCWPVIQNWASGRGNRYVIHLLLLVTLMVGPRLWAELPPAAQSKVLEDQTVAPQPPAIPITDTRATSDRGSQATDSDPSNVDPVSHRETRQSPDHSIDARFSYGVHAAFLLPQNDLKLTTESFPDVSVEAYAQFLFRGVHQLRPTAEWWYFRQGQQSSSDPIRSQLLDTRVRALVFGGEYLHRIFTPTSRLSAGGGLYLMRWSVASVNSITLIPGGTATASGTSNWIRLGEGLGATWRLSRRLEMQSRFIHSHYGYENIPVNVFVLGAGWRL
jgi:hypothetical protein